MIKYFISNDAKKLYVQVDDDKHQQFWHNDIKLKGTIVPIMVSYVGAFTLILRTLYLIGLHKQEWNYLRCNHLSGIARVQGSLTIFGKNGPNT